jgi:hypothetical protein
MTFFLMTLCRATFANAGMRRVRIYAPLMNGCGTATMLSMSHTIFKSEQKFGSVFTLLAMLHKGFRPSCALDTGGPFVISEFTSPVSVRLIHTYMHARTHAHAHTRTHARTHTYIHTHTHTYIHTYIHTYCLSVVCIDG